MAIQAASGSFTLAADSFPFPSFDSLPFPSPSGPLPLGTCPAFPPPSSQQSGFLWPFLPQLKHLPENGVFFPLPPPAWKAVFSSFLEDLPRDRQSCLLVTVCIRSSRDRYVPMMLDVALRAEM